MLYEFIQCLSIDHHLVQEILRFPLQDGITSTLLTFAFCSKLVFTYSLEAQEKRLRCYL